MAEAARAQPGPAAMDIPKIELALGSSSTDARITQLDFLHGAIELDEVDKHTLAQLLKLLFRTHSAYEDRPSRRAVQRCLASVFESRDTILLRPFVEALYQEAAKPAVAPKDAFVLVEWSSLLMQTLATTPTWEKLGSQIVVALASALEKCLRPTTRESVGHSAVVISRRGFRALVGKKETHEKPIHDAVEALAAKGTQPTAKYAPLLGVIAGVCARIPEARVSFANFKTAYFSFWSREIVGSRTEVPSHLAGGLNDFFETFVSQADLDKEVFPVLEKGLLRAPEVVLDLIKPVVHSVSEDFDLSGALANRLLKPLLSNVKSTNAAIRTGAVSAFKELITGCRDFTVLEGVAGEILAPLKTGKLASADHRVLHGEMLAALPSTSQISAILAEGLLSVIAKENNDAALAAETAALNSATIDLLSTGGDISKALLDLYVKGLSDKKVPFRRVWILRTGEILFYFRADEALPAKVIHFAEATLPPLLTLAEEAFTNQTAAVQSGAALAAYVALSLPHLLQTPPSASLKMLAKKYPVHGRSLTRSASPSFLLSPRIYGRLTADDDLQWFYRALLAPIPAPGDSAAWGEALIYSICAAAIPHTVRREGLEALSSTYAKQPLPVSRLVHDGLVGWIESLSEKDSAAMLAKTGTDNLHLVLHAICLTPKEYALRTGSEPSKEDLQTQMQLFQILLRPAVLPGARWIDLCLRVGLDPGEMAKKYGARLLNAEDGSSERLQAPVFAQAAADAAAELVFLAPADMSPVVQTAYQSALSTEGLLDIGPMEIAISQTPPDVAFVDVLASKHNAVPDKNSKDYKVLQWEEEIRAQIAQKRGQQQKKLTTAEQAKIDAQLRKEAGIRKHVFEVRERLLRGIGIITSLAKGPPTDATLWLRSAVKALLEAIDAGACLITGDAAPKALLACSGLLAARFGAMRPFVGVAMLRAHEVTDLPEEFVEEPFEQQIARVLYRLRFLSEQRPLDVVSLVYITPLLLLTLDKGGFGTEADDRDVQLVLAIEILAFHTDVCTDEALPRGDIIAALIAAMQRYQQHYKIIKDCFSDMVRCVAPNMRPDEIAVLARGAIVPQSTVRNTVLQAISSEVDMSELDFSEEIWLASHDDLDENAELGGEIWEESEFKVSEDTPTQMLPYLESKDDQLRRAAARSVAGACKVETSTVGPVLQNLRDAYTEFARPRMPQLDEYGMPRKMDLSDRWEARHGIAYVFMELAPLLDHEQLDTFFAFLIEKGPLGDRDSTVRTEMLEAAITAINVHGKSILDELIKTFERTLEAPDKNSETADMVKEAVVIMYGALARHLTPGDAKIPVVVERLLATLNTPSETVQYAIAECLPPLIRMCADQSSKYVEQVLNTLLTAKKYAVQRGAAYGLAGLISGRGINILREYRILSTLKGALENKKEASQREGALVAYELLSTILGRLFEPYVIQIVPQLLTGFGDANANVRDAALAAAKACFAKLSSFGVKQILPTLLHGLDDQQWRSKKGACDLLGAMAYLDPQQLAQSLPEIIPPLTAVLNDSHKEVRAAANKSLKRFGEVISNPEIKSLVDILLKALSDPTKYTDDALDSLIKVQFVHYLDAPSLALVSRVLQRGLGDRSATKRKASQVIGSLAHLTERKDLISHLPVLVGGLKTAIVDPVPTTRATASRALGSLVEKLGEDALPDLIPGLMQTLKSDTGAGDRLGSAQALSEVLAGLGTTRLEETLPTILQNVESAKPAVREGFMSLFIFLPVCFGNSFAGYLGRIIPPILSGLADDVESIRETALRAGRLLVKNFAVRAVDLLLPELERGLADDSYRIRLSSVELVGDLLFNLSGIEGREDAEDEDEAEQLDAAKEAGASLREVLGEEKRNKILSALYICRCDTAQAVRAAAITVWKALVSTPRTLKELVPTLTQLIIRRLGSSNMEHKVIASNALGELIRKAGDGVLASLLPTLEEGLRSSTDRDSKQGICLALKELISAASPEALEDHEKTLIQVVRTALTDSDEDVREAAAEAFDSLQQILGKQAVDQVLPFLLNLLRSEEEANNALQALLTLLTETTRSNIILPNLIPTLIAPPISAFNARALASLSRVAGSAMNRRLPNIINSMMDNIISSTEESLRSALDDSFDTVILSIDEYDGLNTIMNVLLQLMKHEDHRRRASTASHLATFFAKSDVDYSRYNQDIIRALLISFDDRDEEVVKAAWAALSEFTKNLRKEEMEALVPSTRQTLLQVGVAGSNLPGFELPKGINAILPIFLQGLMNGTPEQRTQAALAISDMVDRASEAALKPFVTQITGPLIRVVSERSTDVKAAILLTLNNLLEKMPAALKPFLPQLQRTFAKSLADTNSEVLRSRAAKALGTLIRYTPRVDPLVAELVTGSKTSDPGVRTAMLKALFEVVSRAGKNMGETSRAAVLGLIDTDTSAGEEGSGGGDAMTITNAKLFGALISNVPADVATGLLKSRVMMGHANPQSVLALNAVLVESREALLGGPLAEDLPGLLRAGMGSKNPFIADNFVLATGKYLLPPPSDLGADNNIPGSDFIPQTSFETSKSLLTSIAQLIPPGGPTDTRRLALVLVRTLSRAVPDMVRPHLTLLAPPVFASVRDPVIPVKLAAEAAFVSLFSVVDEENKVFDRWLSSLKDDEPGITPAVKRSMGDYFKRVALRLGAQAKERRDAEGGSGGLGLSGDEVEDEREIWSVGRVDVGESVFGD